MDEAFKDFDTVVAQTYTTTSEKSSSDSIAAADEDVKVDNSGGLKIKLFAFHNSANLMSSDSDTNKSNPPSLDATQENPLSVSYIGSSQEIKDILKEQVP